MSRGRQFTNQEDDIITDIFDRIRTESLTNDQVVNEFRRRANRRLVYSTLFQRYTILNEVINPMSTEALNEENLQNGQEDVEVEEARELSENNELNNDMSILSIQEDNDQNEVEMSEMSVEQELNQNLGGRPRGGLRRRTRLTVRGERERNVVRQPIVNINIGLSSNGRSNRRIVYTSTGTRRGRRIRNESQTERRERLNRQSQSQRAYLTRQTNEQRNRRLTHQRILTNTNRANATPQQTNQRLESQIVRTNTNRANETPQQTNQRLESQIVRTNTNRANATSQQTNQRLESQRVRTNTNRANATPQQTNQRLESQRVRTNTNRANETPEQTETRLALNSERMRVRRAQETALQRQHRLDYQRGYRANRNANETEEQRMDRLRLNYQQRQNQRNLLPTYKLWTSTNRQPVVALNVGTMSEVCQYCGAKFWPGERNTRGEYKDCCENDKIRVPNIENAHPTMLNLVHPDHIRTTVQRVVSQDFLKNIREYNSLFAMAVIQAKTDLHDLDNQQNYRQRMNARGTHYLPFLYKIHGAIHYLMPPMFNGPNGNQRLRAAQFYMFDTDQNIRDQRINAWRGYNGAIAPDIVELIQQMLNEVNPLVRVFCTNRELLQRQNTTDPYNCLMWLTRNVPQNPNIPLNANGRRQIIDMTVNGEIAVIFNDSDGLPQPNGYIALAVARDNHMPMINVVPQRENNYTEFIDIRDPNCDPLTFPIMFPYAETGYDERIEHNVAIRRAHNRLTLREFYKYRMHMRQNSPDIMFYMGKLYQEYVVASYVKVESNDLNFIRTHQYNLRIFDYQGVVDHYDNDNNPTDDIPGPGRAFILPSTHEGSDRAMRQHYFDSMEIAKYYNKGDLFITFTANPQWEEITNHIPAGSNYLNRPDICARVYDLKFNDFWDNITKNHVLGVCDAHVNVKEYQKRSLAHNHGVVWFDENDRITTTERIDEIISAEIPDREEDPELYELVVKLMMHGPCTPTSPCMAKYGDKCSKGFPKPFSEETVILNNNYPRYKRRNNGRTVQVRGHTLDNRFVVPYNAKMLKRYKSHINVEVCAFLSVMKYLFDYVCKGNDRVNVELHGMNNIFPHVNRGMNINELNQIRANQNANNNLNQVNPQANQVNEPDPNLNQQENELPNDNLEVQVNRELNPEEDRTVHVYDEITRYQMKRYVSPIEAIDKLFGKKRLMMSHTVYRLPIHLENRQNIVFNVENILERTRNQALAAPVTMLIDYFALNERSVQARQYLYREIPEVYWWDKSERCWKVRIDINRAEKAIGRINFIHPRNRELFHLRLLLLNVRGAVSFQDLRTVHGIEYPTFTAAAIALNLVDNDTQWIECIRELIHNELPYRIRFLFATILYHNTPENPSPIELWNMFSEDMSRDYIEINQDPIDIAKEKSLLHIKYVLEGFGVTMGHFGLPEPINNELNWRHIRMQTNQHELNETQHRTEAERLEQTLNEEQRYAMNRIMQAVDDNNAQNSKCLELDGPGGSGKTYLLNVLYHKLAARNYKIVPTAYTGIAAALLVGGGRTIHSRFKLPIPTELGSTSNINIQSIEANQLREAALFIIDEASMVSRAVLECIDRVLRDITQNLNVPFGGKPILLTGDFRQCAPVTDNDTIESCIQLCLKNSVLWRHFVRLPLTQNVRADPNEIEFKEWIMSIGNGTSRIYDNVNLIRMPDRVMCNRNIVDETFGDGQIMPDQRDRLNNVILCPTNRDSLEINEVILDRVDGELYEYFSRDEIIDEPDRADEHRIIPIEQANHRTPQGFPPHNLRLKVGAVVILLKNWSLMDGLCNGNRLRVEQCNHNTIRCSLLNGPNAGNQYTFCRTQFNPPSNEVNIRFRRYQFPFRLAFSMTINKSQGQTFNRVGLFLRTPCFSHGQLYVAISRVRNFGSLSVIIEKHENGIYRQGELPGYDGGFYTKNVVYQEILN